MEDILQCTYIGVYIFVCLLCVCIYLYVYYECKMEDILQALWLFGMCVCVCVCVCVQ
jgi:hypothetical protein